MTSPPSRHGGSDHRPQMAHAQDIDDERPLGSVRVTVIVQNRYALDGGPMKGRHLKEATNVPETFALYRRLKGGNEPIPDDTPVEVHDGDHFFARPPSNAS